MDGNTTDLFRSYSQIIDILTETENAIQNIETSAEWKENLQWIENTFIDSLDKTKEILNLQKFYMKIHIKNKIEIAAYQKIRLLIAT